MIRIFTIKKKYITLLTSFLTILTLSQSLLLLGQNELTQPKSLKDTFHEKIKAYNKKGYTFGLEKKFDSATYYNEKALELSKEINNPQFLAYSNLFKAEILYWQADIKNATSLLSEILNNEHINDSIKLYANYMHGKISHYEKKYTASLKHYLSAEKLVAKHSVLTKRDSNRIAIYSFKIGDIHLELKNIYKAKVYYDKALVNAKNAKLKSSILFQISTLYEDEENISQAINYSLKATSIASENKWQLMLPTYYAELSKYYIRANKGDSAIYYAKKGLHNNTYCRLNWLNSNIGEAYLINKNYPRAITYFKTALKYTTPEETLEVYGMLREAYSQTRQYKLALSLNEKFLILKDSLDNLKVRQEIVAITEKYESDKKQLKIKSLNEKNDLNNVVINKQKTQIVLFVLLFIFSIFILGFISLFYIKQKRQRNLLYIKNRELAKKLENKEESKKKNDVSNIEDFKKNEIHNFINNLIDAEFYLDRDITLSIMAKKAKTNTSYLSKIINEDYNKSFTNFINDHRIAYTLKKLEMLPEYRKLTIEHIGEKAGFSSSNAFYRAFSKYTGLTPSYYIKRTLQ